MAVLVGALAGGTLLPAPATAQGFGFGWLDGPPKKYKKVKRQTQRPSTARKRQSATVMPKREPDGPVVLTISLKSQRVKVFDQEGLVAEAPISSGRVGNATPTGVFSILQKRKMHYSNLYNSAPMPNMQRITWSGVALHAGVLPGYPASHGCIRLPHSFSKMLFNMTELGNRVIVARDTLVPQSFAHPKLFNAFPEDDQDNENNKNGAMTQAQATGTNAMKVADASGQTVPTARAETGPEQAIKTATIDPDHPMVVMRNAFREKRKAEMARLTAAVAAAEDAKTLVVEGINDAANASEIATNAWKDARKAATTATNERKELAKKLNNAEKELAAFAKKLTSAKSLTVEEAQKLVGTENALEARISELSDALAAAKRDERRLDIEYQYARLEAEGAARLRNAAKVELSKAESRISEAKKAVEDEKRLQAKRDKPIAVFVSLKTKKIYARQGYQPVLEAPIEIRDPDRPIGTHVFTAHAIADNKIDVDWSVVSMPTQPRTEKANSSKKSKKKKDELRAALPNALSVSGQSPSEALDRITFPQEVIEQIADVMKPGSSLIISDNGMSNETGKYTDFIVSLR